MTSTSSYGIARIKASLHQGCHFRAPGGTLLRAGSDAADSAVREGSSRLPVSGTVDVGFDRLA